MVLNCALMIASARGSSSKICRRLRAAPIRKSSLKASFRLDRVCVCDKVGWETQRHRDTAKRTKAIFHRSEEHTSELQSRGHLVCRLLLEKKKKKKHTTNARQC